MCVNEVVGDYTDGERGTVSASACRACRFVVITGAKSVRFDARINRGGRGLIHRGSSGHNRDIRMCSRAYLKEYEVVELVQTYRTVQCEGRSGRGVE
jgi:hypothetical protein